ncbi:MAG: ornithine cyclodeaminase family protein, partial [Solirubrobacterales bacterium]
VCADLRPETASALAAELGWRAGPPAHALAQDVVVTVTPGERSVVSAGGLLAGQHFAALGADAHGKAEVELAALTRCRLFCDDWAQAAAGGELSAAVDAGRVRREDVTPLGEVLLGRAAGRTSAEEITLFDSTGLAIQDLAVAAAVIDAWRRDELAAPTVSL